MLKNTEKTMDKLVALCKNRGFVYAGSEIYGGLANTWDYGPLGAEMKNNIKRAWWKRFVQESENSYGVDAAILMNSRVWEASGHTASFTDFMYHYDITLMNPKVLSGIFIGSMMAFLFCGLTMNAVGRAAARMVEEVRHQFREIKGILTGEARPDYARCVEISTKGAQHEMVFPSLLAIIAPIATGLIFGVPGVVGLLVGGLGAGFVLAIFMANAGGAWDNAKKYTEEGHFGGKGSETHRATVVGDTVGDPFKDTSGPSLNILIKLMSMVAIVMAGLTVAWSLF